MAKTFEQEIAEAVNAANDALYHLYNADEMLAKAKNWGIADIMGGGLFVTHVKRKHMREASAEINRAKRALTVMNREILDLNGLINVEEDLGGFMEIADYVFDNAMMDLVSQSRINRTRDQVKDTIAQVEGILDALGNL